MDSLSPRARLAILHSASHERAGKRVSGSFGGGTEDLNPICLLAVIIIIIIIIIITIIIRYVCLLSQAFSSWYFTRTSGDPHRSGFKFHTAVLSILCVMFQV